jgi:hypothetical protein
MAEAHPGTEKDFDGWFQAKYESRKLNAEHRPSK